MRIIPAVDIKEGRCIRLQQGRPGTESVYSEDPVSVARRWESEGAEWLHVVDLDGAFSGLPKNRDLVADLIKASRIPVQVSGGIRTIEDIKFYIKSGAHSTIIGTKVVEDPNFVKEACAALPGRISIGLDARDGMLQVQGWTASTPWSAVEVAKIYGAMALHSIIFTDVRRDGMLQGPNLAAIRKLAESTPVPIVASGGISSLEDLRALLKLEGIGVTGVIIGKALYTGAIRLGDAIRLGAGGTG